MGNCQYLVVWYLEENENAAKECIDEDVHDVEVDVQAMLLSFDVFSDRAGI